MDAKIHHGSGVRLWVNVGRCKGLWGEGATHNDTAERSESLTG